MKASNNLLNFIENELPKNGEWWDFDNCHNFQEIASELVEKGIEEKEIKDMLQTLYSAVCNEFGN